MSDITRLIAEAEVLAGGKHQCSILGHDWQFSGGMSCCCDGGNCSLPVYHCQSCGDYDYGDNDEAMEIREKCDAPLGLT